jgi:CBS domain-containing protein
MTRDVATIPPDANLVDAAKIMRARSIGFLPVVDRDRVFGVLTDRDIVIRGICEGRDPRRTTVRDVMSRVWIWCYEDEVLTEAASILADNHIRRLVVFDHNKRLVGLLSLDDLAARMSSERLLGTTLRGVTAVA